MKTHLIHDGRAEKLKVELDKMLSEGKEIIEVIVTHEKGVYIVLYKDPIEE